MKSRFLSVALGALLVADLSFVTLGGVTVYEDGSKKIEIGGRVQLQFLKVDPDDGESTDKLFFRRLRPYIAGTVTENWMGKIQIDFGKAGDDDEVAVKDAYMQYQTGNLKVTIGNAKHGFSREALTSSKRQQLIERSFVGDHNFATPDRIAGVKVEGKSDSGKVTYIVGGGSYWSRTLRHYLLQLVPWSPFATNPATKAKASKGLVIPLEASVRAPLGNPSS
jgi:phosphate-selective porin